MKHRLVAIGDSLTQGFMSGAIHRTELSYPAMIAESMGIRSDFLLPDFLGQGGLPLNLETIVGELSDAYGKKINWWELFGLFTTIRNRLDRIEDYWERGLGSQPVDAPPTHHNLAVWGFEVRDAHTVTEGMCRREIPEAKDELFDQMPKMPMYRTARRVLNPTFADTAMEWPQVQVAKELANDGGIENLIVYLGANNVLGTVMSLAIRYSEEADLHRLPHDRTCNLYLPEHFARLYAEMADTVEAIGAERVFVATVPHVTIPPVTRGVSPGDTRIDGYFEFYTRPWVWDPDFDPARHEHLTRDDARQIDGFIDQYNETIVNEAGRRGWHVCDLCTLLDQLAYRRQGGAPTYRFSPALTEALQKHEPLSYLVSDGSVQLDTRFFTCRNDQPTQIREGGLFSLDGVHPSTIGYGIIADAFLKTMTEAAVPFLKPLDWDAVVRADALINRPPALMSTLRQTLRMFDKHGLLSKILHCF